MSKKYHQKSFTAEEKRKAIHTYEGKIHYSARYSGEFPRLFVDPMVEALWTLADRLFVASDTEWEYRHVIVPKPLVRFIPPGVCAEEVWRGIGIKQSPGWEMYMRHEPHVLLFRRPKNYDQLHRPFSQTLAARQLNIATTKPRALAEPTK
ncbi:hypothetical protein L202_05433 [Cryptococcus amylolentus CBS 6039]|uniref:Cyclin-dependent kinases regulatory subunit n=2 Tax=Cryptococcus amylolentus TaxID=104669 RepID=A0A1E3HKH9_9TREE|nr:hypothetical protein L202_05433 [Cryptococcus amylolentus CBS 6039]ODN76839.1 hypothetical protein L202_05433 [Cryptococcus amylolentus CBS 6039]ODO04752.1 hypothetical protein I350_05362 [Cryptococcus amylolentus CBS 6273]